MVAQIGVAAITLAAMGGAHRARAIGFVSAFSRTHPFSSGADKLRDEESNRRIQALKPKKQTATMKRRALKPRTTKKADRGLGEHALAERLILIRKLELGFDKKVHVPG